MRSRLEVREVQIDTEGLVTVSGEIYAKGYTHSAEDALQKALEIGFSVMILALEGGGGKDIQKLARNARNMEVQLLADEYGKNISLVGRDCSVQRRYQKIIDRAEVTVANQTRFSRMEKTAVQLEKLVGHVSAGTVEYNYSQSDDKFYFLELNPCLQFEHPTTEIVTSLSALQEVFIPSLTHSSVTFSPILNELISNKLTTEPPETFLAVVCCTVTKADAARVSDSEMNNFAMKPAITYGKFRPPRILKLLEIVNKDLCCEHISIKDFDSWTIQNSELEENKHIRYEYNSFTERFFIKYIECKASLKRGQVLANDILETEFSVDFIYQGKRYKFTATRSRRSYNIYWKEKEVWATRLSLEILDNLSCVKHATPFNSQLSDFGIVQVVGTKLPLRFTLLTTVLKNIIDGYGNQFIMATSFKELI
ncbi:hypothetical protein B9Z19DRAFT_1069957 [Tuber borchii]|uniref:ATP-grasp domain-containing protein n=1 Tax=Tuber borchii TaxID=42251 RepID=A0A2T6Z9S1_TUBBO|nr:hypothetical protein B9Z19DRAFT_1069957 [Tuber borchii]